MPDTLGSKSVTSPPPAAPSAIADGGGIWARDVTVTYRNGHTALWNASFAVPRGTAKLAFHSAVWPLR